MRRFAVAILLPVLVIVALAGLRPVPRQAPDALRATVTVTVLFQCAGTRSVTPWVTRVKHGDDIDWALDPASDVSEIDIVPKRGGPLYRWPWTGGNMRGNRERPAQARGMRPNARGEHRYNIYAMCPGPGGSQRREVIDPDIIIDLD
ncbi:MAG: hypothetical protein KF689_09345 [Gemmatimonadaceae bacterium]|nr:hypothetical protein [Gemmatimonadaceae bacterium]MCW5826198.1 hypothetical protein [Gemmatimonadaceae bacterium]